METSELVVWSAMLGGLLTLVTVAVADVVIFRSVAAWRGLVFILTAGFSSVLLCGLVEHWFTLLSGTAVLVLKVSLAPLSGALALNYLGRWMGVASQDPLVHAITVWGSAGMIAAGAIMAALAMVMPPENAPELLAATAIATGLTVVLGTVASVRVAMMGDTLARAMVLACVFLAMMVAGLHASNLHLAFVGTGFRVVTAFSTVAFFLLVTALSIRRSRITRQLERLAGLAQGADPATGLPRGSVLLSKVDDAFWRSARMHRECSVICIHIRNLYELGEVAGHQVDQQLLVALAARIRRAVGFRNVVGLYHPRCFVVVISAVKEQRIVQNMELRIRYVLAKPLSVVGDDDGHHEFLARFGIGVVTVHATSADPATVIDEAERIALSTNVGPQDPLE
jgi:diguanylate cyclase (GGDEF)-like protein